MTVFPRLREAISRAWFLSITGASLRTTMLVVIVLGVVSPAVVLLVLEQRLSQQTLQALLAQSESAVMAVGKMSLVEPMWTVDTPALRKAARELLENPLVVAVRIEENRPKAAPIVLAKPGVPQALAPGQSAPGLAHRRSAVRRDGELIGALHVWFDTAAGQKILNERRNNMLWLVSIQALISLGILSVVLVGRVLRPIDRLKQQATALVSTAATTQPVFIWQRQDEIGQLGRHLADVQGQLARLFGELERKNEQLQQLALYDQLTGLPNRSLFLDLVQRELQHARRTQVRFGLLFIDIDRFKTINDSMGHQAGDLLLIEVSRRLRTTLRDEDVICRQSGDEFLVMVRDVQGFESLADVAERLLRAVEVPVLLSQVPAPVPVRVSASIGITLFPADGDDFEALVKHADIAMYQAKTLGRGRYSFFHSELNSRLQATLELEQQLSQAVAGGELVLHYQPQVDARSGRLVGVEALVRWLHPQRGLLYPGAFIGVAEECGKIADIGVWTLGAACAQLAAWKARGIDVGCVAVNVSALEFRDHRLLDSVQRALDTSGLAPSELEIEITESVLMADTEVSQRIIERLRELGVGLAIDDFGTGYSSLAYLKRLRPTQLKIDQTFVHDAATDADSRAIVNGVISLATALGLGVVAEGVETREQQDFLTESGCSTLQGYLIARPLPADAFEQWVAARAVA